MSVQAILLPVFAQVTLVFFLLFWMGRARLGAIRRGEVKVADLKRDWSAWPERTNQISDSFRNQFQLPVLFYLVVLTALITAQADLVFVVLAWLFVVTRVIHAYIHTGSNNVPQRFRAFLIGALILMIMWLYLLLKLFVGL